MPDFVPFGFAGGMLDAETGLTRLGARDYDSVVGRWTGKGAVRFDGGQGNLYEYARGNPVGRVEPRGTGKACTACLDAANSAWWDCMVLCNKFYASQPTLLWWCRNVNCGAMHERERRASIARVQRLHEVATRVHVAAALDDPFALEAGVEDAGRVGHGVAVPKLQHVLGAKLTRQLARLPPRRSVEVSRNVSVTDVAP